MNTWHACSEKFSFDGSYRFVNEDGILQVTRRSTSPTYRVHGLNKVESCSACRLRRILWMFTAFDSYKDSFHSARALAAIPLRSPTCFAEFRAEWNAAAPNYRPKLSTIPQIFGPLKESSPKRWKERRKDKERRALLLPTSSLEFSQFV